MESVMERFEDWAHLRHHGQSQTPAPGPVTLAAAPPEESIHMSLSADLHAVANRLENYDDDTLAALDAVKANPATADAFAVLRDLTGFNVNPSIITLVTSGLTALRGQLQAEAAASGATPADVAPAGPVIAGQA
jgi:hypothetical protein